MAYDKMINCTQLDAALTATANAIRSKTGGTTSLSWNASTGFTNAVNSITSVKNQTKTGITPTETAQTIGFDTGYTGLNSVQINAISPTYIGSGVLKKAAQTYTPTTTNQTIASGQYLTGVQTVAGSSNLVASNIRSGVTIFGVTGNFKQNYLTLTSTTITISETYYAAPRTDLTEKTFYISNSVIPFGCSSTGVGFRFATFSCSGAAVSVFIYNGKITSIGNTSIAVTLKLFGSTTTSTLVDTTKITLYFAYLKYSEPRT